MLRRLFLCQGIKTIAQRLCCRQSVTEAVVAEHREEELRARRTAQLAGDGNLAAKLRRDEARLCLNISKMEERLQRLAPDPGLVEEVERLAVERTVVPEYILLSEIILLYKVR